MNFITSIHKSIFEIITSKDPVNIKTTQNLLDKDSIKYAYQFTKILNELKNERVLYKIQGTKIRYSFMGLEGVIKIRLTNLGFLRRIMIIPEETKKISPQNFCDLLNRISSKYSLFIRNSSYCYKRNTEQKLAVSSLVKLLIAALVYASIDANKLTLNRTVTIKDSDLSVLSAGISKEDIGKNITIQELLSYMLIASDNTTMDILIDELDIKDMQQNMQKIIGYHTNIQKTKILYSTAWGGNEAKMRNNARFEVVWNQGLDYFLSLEDINNVCQRLKKTAWLPWDELGTKHSIIYKGGNAPGVLAATWSNRRIHDKDTFLGYVINSESAIPLVAEIHLNAFAKKLY